MATPRKPTDQVLVAILNDLALIQIKDRGSFKTSASLKEFGIKAIGQGVRTLVMDMSECAGMDSTFMGVIAGLAFRLRKACKGRIVMAELNTRTRGLLSTLGLDQLVDAYMKDEAPEDLQPILAFTQKLSGLAPGDLSREETARLMLEAHENLVDVTPENLPRFKDVLTFLREDLIKDAVEGPEAD